MILDQTAFNALSDCNKWREYRDATGSLRARCDELAVMREALAEGRSIRHFEGCAIEPCSCSKIGIDLAMGKNP